MSRGETVAVDLLLANTERRPLNHPHLREPSNGRVFGCCAGERPRENGGVTYSPNCSGCRVYAAAHAIADPSRMAVGPRGLEPLSRTLIDSMDEFDPIRVTVERELARREYPQTEERS